VMVNPVANVDENVTVPVDVPPPEFVTVAV
jgi:hypothetical protein